MIINFVCLQLLKCGDKVLLRNAQRDSRKGGKFNKRWLVYDVKDGGV